MSTRRIAIGFSNCLGNFVIMTAALKILREREKDSEIFMITDEDILHKHPAVKALSGRLFDDVVTNYTKNSFDEIYVGDWSCPQCMVAKGDAHKTAVWWTGSAPYSGMHEVQVYLKMIGATNSDFSGFMMKVADEPILEQKHPRVVLANVSNRVGSRKGQKAGWDKFPELSQILTALKYEVILVGQGLELEGCVGINFVDKLDIFETAKVISQCDLMISTDTGLMHIADSLNVPIVVLAGPTPMTKAHPLVSPYRVVRNFISCAPCYQSTLWNFCSDSVCMKGIKVDDVLKEVFSFNLQRDVPKLMSMSPYIDKALSLPQEGKKSVKIVMPYYGGDQRIDAAVQTWPKDVLLLAVTDEGTIPPSGYKYFFTPDNAKRRGLSKKTKPISKDIFQRLLAQYPDEDFYGYANSDIILPPGIEVSSLFPSDGYITAVHHRRDVKEFEGDNRNIIYWSGKDCFVWTSDVARRIADEYPELVIGSCNWDDGLAHWLWRIYGKDAIDIRYGEVWHKLHHPGWTGSDPDAQYNGATLEAFGITTHLRHTYDWKGQYEAWTKRKNKIGIIQPGRIGDLLLCLPIAKWYTDKGYEVVWPLCNKYLSLFKCIDYVKPIGVGDDIGQCYQKSVEILKGQVGKVINLGIGFGRHEEDWLSSGLSFDRWKYKEAGVPYTERYNLQIKRDRKKEEALKEHLKLTKDYTITHSQGESAGSFNFDKVGAVDVHPVEGYTLFDWIGILEGAKSIYCINSCVMNLIESLGIGKDRRYAKFSAWETDVVRAPLLNPKLSSDWKLFEDEKDRILPVAFFTIVFNGMPFIEYHLEKFRQLPFPWHWYIIEGLSEVAGDSGADGHRARGGHVPVDRSQYLSTDGTKEYLDKINELRDVTLFRNGDVWPSKLRMINTPLPHINYDCLLWQIDADEFYPIDSMVELHRMFMSQPTKTAAIVPHTNFINIKKCVVPDKGRQLWGSQWFPRIWRYEPGCKWYSHEPPVLNDKRGRDLNKINPFHDVETEKLGYHHYGYVHPAQIRFKESYYGYKGLYESWIDIGKTDGLVKVDDYFPWPEVVGAFADDFQDEYLIPVDQW